MTPHAITQLGRAATWALCLFVGGTLGFRIGLVAASDDSESNADADGLVLGVALGAGAASVLTSVLFGPATPRFQEPIARSPSPSASGTPPPASPPRRHAAPTLNE